MNCAMISPSSSVNQALAPWAEWACTSEPWQHQKSSVGDPQ
jgi:hypothetical protein